MKEVLLEALEALENEASTATFPDSKKKPKLVAIEITKSSKKPDSMNEKMEEEYVEHDPVQIASILQTKYPEIYDEICSELDTDDSEDSYMA